MNQGNTCYLSAAVQCLSNIAPLREYLFSAQMLQELNQENSLGSGGKVALAFTALLSHIWHGDN